MKKRLLPLGIKNRTQTELPALVALEAIGQPWFGASHLADLQALGLVSKMLAAEGSHIHLIAAELLSLLEAGALALDEIRPRVVDLTAWIHVQPNNRVDAVIEALLRQERTGSG